jgi:hypothetical protein
MRRTIVLLSLLGACAPKTDPVAKTRDRELDSAAAAAAPDTFPGVSAMPAGLDSALSWPRLAELVRAAPDSIRAVQQVHTRAVTVLLKNGRRYHATEPAIDDIIRLLKEVDPAGRILIATE